MIEILKLLEEIEADAQMDRVEWMQMMNQKFNDDFPVTNENYYPRLCGTMQAKISFVILKVKRYIEDYEFMQKKLREEWEEEWREEHGC